MPLPKRRIDEEHDPLDAIANSQDRAVASARLPPHSMPEPTYTDDPADVLPGVPFSTKPTYTDDPSTQDPGAPSTPYDEWMKQHPQGLDLGSNEKSIASARAARDAVRGKRVTVGRPDMPAEQSHAFTDLSLSAPREGTPGVEVVDSRPKIAGDTSSGSRPKDDMLDAELFANGRRMRTGLEQAGRIIGRAGLAKNPQSAAMDAAENGQADASVKEVQGRRAETRAKAADARELEDQTFQRNTDARAAENQGYTREKNVRDREYNTPGTPIAQRRLAEGMGLYGKQLSKIPLSDLKQLTASDMDVLFKELAQEKSRSSQDRNSAAMERAFAAQVAKVGDNTAKQPYGEVEGVAQRLEQLAPGITGGSYKGEDPLGGTIDRGLMSLPRGMGEGFVGDKQLQTHKALKEMTDLIERMRSGAVINDQEAAHYNGLLGGGIGQDPRSLSMGLNTVLTSLRQKAKNAQAGYTYLRNGKGQSPLDVYAGAGGTDYRQHAGGGAPAGGKIKVSNGSETVMIDPADEADAARDHFHRVP